MSHVDFYDVEDGLFQHVKSRLSSPGVVAQLTPYKRGKDAWDEQPNFHKGNQGRDEGAYVCLNISGCCIQIERLNCAFPKRRFEIVDFTQRLVQLSSPAELDCRRMRKFALELVDYQSGKLGFAGFERASYLFSDGVVRSSHHD